MPESVPSILIVDDRPEKLLSLETVLEDIGARIVLAESGRDALRAVLNEEFAVILLDVNMPGLDGFETAQMIRQRANSRHIPIIFLTAFGDDLHMTRGYSMGAVDYIQMPFVPEVLRTKVSVFVDVFRKSIQVKEQADSLARRAEQLQKLAAASLAINSERSIPKMLQIVTHSARDIIGSHQAITLFLTGNTGAARDKIDSYTSCSDAISERRTKPLQLDELADSLVVQNPRPTRLSERELKDHPDWKIVQNLGLPPIRGGVLTAPLRGGEGHPLGVIYLAERYDGEFTGDDQAILVQLSQMAAIAIENIIYSREREANRLKDEFLATLSHELRTPLSAIRGWTYLLRKEVVSENAVHGLDVIERNTKAQMKLIEDLLDVSRITTGTLRLNLRRIRIHGVIEAAVDSMLPSAREKNITLENHVEDDAFEILADPDRLQQVIWNLLNNAVKFTPASGRVKITVVSAGGMVNIQVIDNGPGIKSEFLPFVFDRFRQADSTSTRTYGGLGIGLAIVRHIVEQHRGSVCATNASDGHGAVFRVSLPLAKPTNGAAIAIETSDPLPANDLADLQGIRILIVDDEEDAREVVCKILKCCNAKIEVAGSAAEAMNAFTAFRPDILVSDIAMPEADGFELIRQVRSLPPEMGGETPAIALTAYALPADRNLTLQAGFQSHLPKPVDPQVLVEQIISQNLQRK